MSKEMLDHNQDLMDQAKQIISGGKYKKKITNSTTKRKVPTEIKIGKKSKLSKRADFVLTLSVLIITTHIYLCFSSYETFKTPSANGHGGYLEFLAFIVVPILFLAWIIEIVAFGTFLLLCNKQKKSSKPDLRAEVKDKRKAVDIAILVSFLSAVAFWVFFFILCNSTYQKSSMFA